MENDEYHDMVRRLTAMLVAQHEMNVRVEGFMQRQDTVNERLTLAIEDLKAINASAQITQARIETLLARMIAASDNGRDA